MTNRRLRKSLVMLMVTLLAITWSSVPQRAQAAASPLSLQLGDPIEGGINWNQSYWDLQRNVAVVHTSSEAIYAFSKRAIMYNQKGIGGGFMDMGSMARPNGQETIIAVPALRLYMEEQDEPTSGHLYVLKAKGDTYYALYIEDIQVIEDDAAFAFTLYKLAGAPAAWNGSVPAPQPPTTTRTMNLDLGSPVDGGIGGDQDYWDLAKSAAVVHTTGEAIKAFSTRAIMYNISEAGGGFMDMGAMQKPLGKQTIQATPVLRIYNEEQDNPTAGHLYVLKTKSLGYLALYMDDIQVVKDEGYFSFTLYKLAKAPYAGSTTQPTPTPTPTPTPVPIPTPQPVNPGAPNQLAATAGDGSITLSWAGATGVSGYYVYRGTAPRGEDSTPLMDFPVTTTQYRDTHVQSGNTYYYIVKAVGKDLVSLSPASNEVCAKLEAVVPATTKIEIWLQIDNPKAKVNGQAVDLPAAPAMIDDRAMVPLRFIGEKLGASVDWEGSQRKVTYTLGSTRIELWVDQTRATVNGQPETLSVAPTTVHDSTFVPLRFVSEKLGAQIVWNPDDMSVTITSTKPSTPTSIPATTPTPNPQPQLPTPTVGKQIPYWVEGGVRLVIDNDVVYEDNDGIYSSVIDPTGTAVAYSHADWQLLVGSLADGTKAVAYEGDDANYRIYPVAWSADGSEIMFISSYSGGFTGGNQLGIFNMDTEKVSWVYKGLDSADWARDGRIVIANVGEMKIIDRQGRDTNNLTPEEGGWFVNADDPTFSPDGSTLIYQLSDTFYLHDIATDKSQQFIETSQEGDPAHMAADGRIIYVNKGTIYIYSPDSRESIAYSKSSQCSYPNWIDKQE